MRFLHVQIENFRAIRRASVEFGPGLNVLFGPNDLGKTTLAAARRAALLLPADSSAHQAFLPWQAGGDTCVSLGFEAQGFDFGYYYSDLSLGRVFIHYDEHAYSPLSATVKMRMPGPATVAG